MPTPHSEIRVGEQKASNEGGSGAHEAITALFRALLDAWGDGDAVAYGALFTEDADYVAFDGSHTRGREAIVASHTPLFERWLKGSRLIGRIEQIRLLHPDIAILHATGSTMFAGETRPRPSRASIQTLVARRNDGVWHFVAFHNTRILRWSRLRWILNGIAERVFRR